MPPVGGDDSLAGLQQYIDSQREDSQMENMIAMIGLLLKAGESQSQGQLPIGALLEDQRERASMQAGSLHPSAQYLPGLNPGGVFDMMAQWGAQNGIGTAQLEPGRRLAVHADMGSFDDALSKAQQVQKLSQGEPNRYAGDIESMVKTVLDKVMGVKPQAVEQASAAPGATDEALTSTIGNLRTGQPAFTDSSYIDSQDTTLPSENAVAEILKRAKARREELNKVVTGAVRDKTFKNVSGRAQGAKYGAKYTPKEPK